VNRVSHRVIAVLRARIRVAILALIAVSLFSGGARAGSRYFVCNAMQEVRSEPCCKRPDQGAQQEVVDCGCCGAHRVAALPPALLGARAEIPTASLTGLLPPSPLAFARALALAPCSAAMDRLLRPPRSGRLALLMVFRN
jgi:hypothetical protein